MLLESFSDEIIEMVSRFLPERTINIMDTSGTIISSTEKERIGTFHKGAEIAAATGEIVNITDETVKNYPGAKKGCNVPLVVNGTIIGVIGIFGNPEDVKTIASFVELYVEKYYQLEALAIPRLRDKEMKQRLLKEMIMPSRDDGIRLLLEKIGINLHFPMECGIFSPNQIENRAEWENQILSILKDDGIIYADDIYGFMGGRLVLFRNNGHKKSLEEDIKTSKVLSICKVSIGDNAPTLEKIPLSYNKASVLDRILNKNLSSMSYFSDRSKYYLHQIASQDNEYLTDKMDRLEKEFKKDELREVMRTAEAYYRLDHSVVKASKEIFVHKNTLWYRMCKLFEVLEIEDCNDFEKEMMISLILEEYLKKEGLESLRK